MRRAAKQRNLDSWYDHLEAGQPTPIGDDEVLDSAELHAREAANAVALLSESERQRGVWLRADRTGTSGRDAGHAVLDLLQSGPHHLVSDAVDTVIGQLKRVGR